MATPLTYATLQNNLLQALVKAQAPGYTPPPDFVTLLPLAISYAEGRIYRDVVMLAQRKQDTSLTTTADSRQISLAGMTLPIVVPEGVALIVPSPISNPAVGTRVPYDMASLDVIDLMWPTEATVVTPSITDWNPRFWALRDAQTIVLCPTPDAVYTAEITGLFQPAPMSGTNATTYLGNTYPEFLEIACMTFLVGELKQNWSSQADDPRMSVSYEQQYSTLLTGVRNEEIRRRGLRPDVAASPPQPQRAA